MGLDKNLNFLSEISIYTFESETHSKEVFKKIFTKEKGKQKSVRIRSAKDELETYFLSILPIFDQNQVYFSDMKKLLIGIIFYWPMVLIFNL